MPLFGRRSKEDQREAPGPSPERPPNDPDGMREATNALSALFEAQVQGEDGRIRVEDLLSAAAAVCGEACMAAAGDFDLEHHPFAPGSPVLSDRVNGILCADAPDWASATLSVFGIIRGGALAQGTGPRSSRPSTRRCERLRPRSGAGTGPRRPGGSSR